MNDKALKLEISRARKALKNAGYIYDKEKGWVYPCTTKKIDPLARKVHRKLPSKESKKIITI